MAIVTTTCAITIAQWILLQEATEIAHMSIFKIQLKSEKSRGKKLQTLKKHSLKILKETFNLTANRLSHVVNTEYKTLCMHFPGEITVAQCLW